MKRTAEEIAALMCGRLQMGSPSAVSEGVSIDTRSLEPGNVFFAIRGPRHDGHDFVSEAIARGASGVVVSEAIRVDEGSFVIRVDDTTEALQELARGVRLGADVRVVAITGSMGKTTTKEAAAAAIGSTYRVIKSEGNLNNLYGLPLSLLRLAGEDVAVVEMGMSSPGEIARLTEIARPDVGVLTNVAEVHLEFFPSVEAIAEAKGELLEGLDEDAVAVVNADDPLVLAQARRFSGRTLPFGLSRRSEVRARNIRKSGEGIRFLVEHETASAEVVSPLLGRHNVYNLLAGVAAARALEVPLAAAASALEGVAPQSHRGERLELGDGIVAIDETYNSNPRALRAALEVLPSFAGRRRIAVVGDMLELGPNAEAMHRASGREAARLGVDLLVGVGPLGRAIVEGAREEGVSDEGLETVADAEEAARVVSHHLREGDVVLFKASRAVGLDRSIALIREGLGHGRS